MNADILQADDSGIVVVFDKHSDWELIFGVLVFGFRVFDQVLDIVDLPGYDLKLLFGGSLLETSLEILVRNIDFGQRQARFLASARRRHVDLDSLCKLEL